jgi:drug/metabolite transporter (DMT)-like permease
MGPARDNIRLGITYMLLSTMANAGMNATMKWCSNSYLPAEIAFFRQLFAMIPVTILIMANGGTALIKTTRPMGHLKRSIIGNISLACILAAYHYLPLADVTAYNFTAPLMLTALSVPLLHEKVGPHRWVAVLVGFIGVLIMMRPRSDLNIGVVYAIGAALTMAFAMITIRNLSRYEHPLTIVFYFTLFGALFAGLASIPGFTAPHGLVAWGLLMLIGCLGGVAQYFTTMCYRHASPPVVAPYNYVTLVWTIGLQFIIWDTLPDGAMIAGGTLIVASGLYIIYREAIRKSYVTSAETPQQAAD